MFLYLILLDRDLTSTITRLCDVRDHERQRKRQLVLSHEVALRVSIVSILRESKRRSIDFESVAIYTRAEVM